MELFDDWAATYDDDLRAGQADFPFLGYAGVLDAMADDVLAAAPTRVLDLGIGTGNLSARLLARDPGLEIWGLDFSARMLDRARRKLPAVRLIRADLRHDLPRLDLPRFAAVAAAYVLHELPDEAQEALVVDLLARRLRSAGLVVVGDIAFPTAAERDATRRAVGPAWDDTEHYLVADRFLDRLAARGIEGRFRPVSPCAGVFVIRVPDAGADRRA